MRSPVDIAGTSLIADFDIKTIHKLVPRDRAKNLRFRKLLLEEARGNVGLQNKLIEICRGNILFWVNSFVWTFDPRHSDPNKRIVPWICYPFQEEALVELKNAIGKYDLTIEKSRDQGATWMCIISYDHCFIFDNSSAFNCGSRNEDLVDKTDSPDSIFWKFDHIHKYLPVWMLDPADVNRYDKHLSNAKTNSTVDGVATTGGMGAGGRNTSLFLDELSLFPIAAGFEALASTQYTTRSRIFNGTPKGRGNAHYTINHPPSKTKKLRFHWSNHPIQNVGLYTTEGGLLKLIDESFWETATLGDLRESCPEFMRDFDDLQSERLPDGQLAKGVYPFNRDGKLRAPYYDNECCRTPIPSQIAQELDIDYVGSGDVIMTSTDVHRVVELYARPPVVKGTLHFDFTTGAFERFEEDDHGILDLWIRPSASGELPKDRHYVVGVDISLGVGASNSVVAIADIDTKETVAEFASSTITPDELARFVYAVASWFNQALVIWEDNGIGNTFRTSLSRLGYSNYWVRTEEGSVKRKRGRRFGYATTGTGKKTLLINAVTALKRGEYICRSQPAIEEFSYYQHSGGTIVHVSSLMAEGPGSDHQENHGDRAIAHALVNHVIKDIVTNTERPAVIPEHCLFNRRKEWQRQEKDDSELRWAV